MRLASILAALVVIGGTTPGRAQTRTNADMPDLHRQVSGSYGAERFRAAPSTAARERRRVEPTRERNAWGPVVGPPGLFL